MNKLGFGFLRLPLQDPDDEQSINMDTVCALVDRFLALGGRYFDTAYTYLGGKSEEAVREALVRRHPRASFELADKLPTWLVHSHADCECYFAQQLARCGVDFFDVYLLHGLDRENYDVCKRFGLFDFLKRLKTEGRAKKIGFSFHDSPELLNEILSEHPEVDCVLLQINYLDWESVALRSKDLYQTAVRHNKRVLVMEPVKGGHLTTLPEKAESTLRQIHPCDSMPLWALRFAQSLDQVDIVLSGMNQIEQIEENLKDADPLSDAELNALQQAAKIIRSMTAVGCTSCGYCLNGCPKSIAIPRYFALYNDYARSPSEAWKMEYAYAAISQSHGKIADCIGCSACVRSCPQKIDIPAHLKKVAQIFDNL